MIRQRLAGTTLADSLNNVVMPPNVENWPDELREQLNGTLKPAGVLMPIMERPAGLTVLLTRRSAALKHHAGQVSFPGGRKEDADSSVLETALRETHEEVGIESRFVSIVGYLPTTPSITAYSVTPIVGFVAGAAELRADPGEVEYTFEVPLEFLLDESNDVLGHWQAGQRSVKMLEFNWQGERIWGLTAFMIRKFREMVLKQ